MAVLADGGDSQTGLEMMTATSRNWILLDRTGGEGTILFTDKHAIMHRFNIHARDLRILDPLLSYPSTILGRDGAIILNLEHIKAIITAEEVLLRDPLDQHVIPVVEELRRRLSAGDSDVSREEESPFEFRVLEVALEATCSFLDARTAELETAAYPVIDELTAEINSSNLDSVCKLKSSMTRLTARVQKVRDELEQLLDDDGDMADLYLSRKLAGVSPLSGSGDPNCSPGSPTTLSKLCTASAATFHGNENDIEDLEMLLESYFMQIYSTLNKLTALREFIDDTEDYINIQLDNHRNQLIQIKLFLNSGTLSLSLYSLIAGIFGMNLKYSWNNGHGYLWGWVTGIGGLLCALVFVAIMVYARHKRLIGS